MSENKLCPDTPFMGDLSLYPDCENYVVVKNRTEHCK